MKQLGLGFAYLCIYTTPIQIIIIFWVLLEILQTDYSLLTLTTKIFLVENLKFLHDWIYSWFWNAYLDFWYQFPALPMVILKTIFSTWFGFWLLKKLKP